MRMRGLCAAILSDAAGQFVLYPGFSPLSRLLKSVGFAITSAGTISASASSPLAGLFRLTQ